MLIPITVLPIVGDMITLSADGAPASGARDQRCGYGRRYCRYRADNDGRAAFVVTGHWSREPARWSRPFSALYDSGRVGGCRLD